MKKQAQQFVRKNLKLNKGLVEQQPVTEKKRRVLNKSIKNALLGLFENPQIAQQLVQSHPYHYQEFKNRIVQKMTQKPSAEKNSVRQAIRRHLQSGTAQLKHVASGSIGAIKQIVLPNGQIYVVKKRHPTQSVKQIRQFQREGDMNQLLSSKVKQHIMPYYYGKTVVNNTPYFIFEKMDSDLVSLFGNKDFVLSEEIKNDMVKQLRKIYQTIRTIFCHGDIHEGNIYYKQDGNKIHLFLGDFGTASMEQQDCRDEQAMEQLIHKIEKHYEQTISRQQQQIFKKQKEHSTQQKMKQFQQNKCVPVIGQQQKTWSGKCVCHKQQFSRPCAQTFASMCALPQFYSRQQVQQQRISCLK